MLRLSLQKSEIDVTIKLLLGRQGKFLMILNLDLSVLVFSINRVQD